MLTEEQLQENGYPRPDPENSSAAKVYTTSQQEQNSAKLKSKASQSSWKYRRKLIKISTCVILQKTAKLTLQLFIYVHVLFHYTLYIHLYMLHRYWLSFIEGKIFISFFYIHKLVHLFCSIWKNLCSMWKALHGLPKWNICPQRRVYLPLGKSMEEEKYDHISL